MLRALYIGCMLMLIPCVVGHSGRRLIRNKESVFDDSQFNDGKITVRLQISEFQVTLSPTPTRLDTAKEKLVVDAIQLVLNNRGSVMQFGGGASWAYALIELPIIKNVFHEGGSDRWLRRRMQTKTTTLVISGGSVGLEIPKGGVTPDISVFDDIVKDVVNQDLVAALSDSGYVVETATYIFSTDAPTTSPSAAPSASPTVTPEVVEMTVLNTEDTTTDETTEDENNDKINFDDAMSAQELNNDNDAPNESGGLGTGGVVGIAFAALLVAAALVGFALHKHQRIHGKFRFVDGTKNIPLDSDEDETYEEDISGTEGRVNRQRDQNIPSPPRTPKTPKERYHQNQHVAADDLSSDASVVSDWTMSTANGDSFAVKGTGSLLSPGGAHPMMCAESFELNRHRQGQIRKDLLHTTPGWEPPTSSVPSPKNVKNNTVLKPSSFSAAEETTQKNNMLLISPSSMSDPDSDDTNDLNLVVESPVMFDESAEEREEDKDDMHLTPPSVVGSKLRKKRR